MKYYRRSYSGSARVQKVMFRILFVIIAAAIITFASIILGSHLQKKVAAAEALRNISEPAQEQITSRPNFTDNSAAQRSVFASGIDISQYATEDEVVAAVNAIAEHYDTVIVHLDDYNGSLLYTSPALCEVMRLPVPNNDSRMSLLRAALTAAKSKNLHLCAISTASLSYMAHDTAVLVDGTIFAELASFGVDEVLINGLISDTGEIQADAVAAYIDGCHKLTGSSFAIGVLIPEEVFLDFSNAKNIQIIASAADFTAIDMTISAPIEPADAYDQTIDHLTSLYGSFSIYNMRVTLSTADRTALAAQYKALLDSNIGNICFTDYIVESSLKYDNTNDTPETIMPNDIPENSLPLDAVDPTDDDADDADHSNPYATGIVQPESEPSYDQDGNEDGESGIKPWY